MWIADLLPDGAAPEIDSMMTRGVVAMRQTLAADARRRRTAVTREPPLTSVWDLL